MKSNQVSDEPFRDKEVPRLNPEISRPHVIATSVFEDVQMSNSEHQVASTPHFAPGANTSQAGVTDPFFDFLPFAAQEPSVEPQGSLTAYPLHVHSQPVPIAARPTANLRVSSIQTTTQLAPAEPVLKPKVEVKINLAILEETGWTDSEGSDSDSDEEEVSTEIKRILA